MRRLRRVIEEERPLAVGGADDGPGFGREELRRVHAVRRGGPVQRGVVAPQVVAGRLQRKRPPPPERDGALEPLAALVARVVLRAETVAEERVEAPVGRQPRPPREAQVPLADHGRGVAPSPEALAERHLALVQSCRLVREEHEEGKARFMRMAAGHERRTRRRAHGRPIKPRQPQALPRELVDDRRRERARPASVRVADVINAEVVGHEHHDVRSFRALSCDCPAWQ